MFPYIKALGAGVGLTGVSTVTWLTLTNTKGSTKPTSGECGGFEIFTSGGEFESVRNDAGKNIKEYHECKEKAEQQISFTAS